jgi:hypothetical protein
VVGWSNIDRADELVSVHSAHIEKCKSELDEKLNQIVEIDRKISELEGAGNE